ncbi:hypothetical protein N2152v2_010011 [Parachlorella kessleri]
MSTSFTGPASYQESRLPEVYKARQQFLDGGVQISLHTPGRERAGLEDFNRGCDMDAIIGFKRKPGVAGAHPTMQQARNTDDYYYMVGQAKSLVKPEEKGAAPGPPQAS